MRKTYNLLEFEGDFNQKKLDLQKESKRISNQKYYKKSKFKIQIQRNLYILQQKELQKKKELDNWIALQQKINKEMDDLILLPKKDKN